ncbi:MAG: response regulator [Chloroflexi bacterium]|nr:response regulator [Chloroflexota bacterium]
MKFLVIDDSFADRELVVRRLRKEFDDAEFVEVGNPRDLDEAMERGGFDIVLTDYQLNWTNGLQIFQRIKEQHPDVPVVMFTGTGSEEIAVEGLRAGLSNYVLKKHLDRLPHAVRESLEKARLRRQYEDAIQQLRISEERYREIFEQGLTGVFAMTPQGKIITCNPAFASIFGFATCEEAMQVNFSTLCPQSEQYTAFIGLLEREKRLEAYEAEMRRCDGQPIYVVENVVGAFDAAGKLLEITGYVFDNTERKQLQQAQRLESVGLLVSGIAHDFNNMLGGILGYTSRGLARVTPNHPLYENFHHIQEIATRAAKMTQQLLAFSRRQVLEPSDVNLNTVVKNLLDFIGKLLADHIEIEFVPDPTLKTVRVDYAQIEQVLMNLCVNARDAMPDGGKLTIRTRNISPEETYRLDHGKIEVRPWVLLSVKDTGIGMDEQVQARIFEPFFTTKEVGKGTGLGLSMVHGIVGQHNGFISVESKSGEGTTFNIYLPTVDDAPVVPSLLPTREISVVQGGDETILVVEDDPDLCYLMKEILSDYGYTVISASDGVEGLQLFEEYADSLSLVVSDLMTPKMRGKELYDRIRAMNEKTRFLFVSGYQANQISQNFVLDKDFSFLPKPFDLDELAGKVREMLTY